MRLVSTVICLLAGGFLLGGLAAGEELMEDGAVWASWTPRPEIKPRFEPTTAREVVISGGGNPDACGCWQRRLPALEEGRRYRVEAAFRAEGVDHPDQSVMAMVTRGDGFYKELTFRGMREGLGRMAADLVATETFDNLILRLCLGFAAEGRVRWSEARVKDVTNSPPRPRLVRLAAISGRPAEADSPAECIEFYCDRLDEAGRGGADLVVLPETINVDRLPADKRGFAEPIPGPSTKKLAEKARQYEMYVAASLMERDGRRLYNTGVLIDRGGEIVGVYRKTHPTISETWLSGRRPGDDYPVFDTDIGRIGYMICYDYHFPEVPRILAVKGAEIIVFSNMGDSREGGGLWESCLRTRAVDNQVHIAASVNQGRSAIVSPRGEILDMVDRTRGAIAIATCDLNASVRDFTRREIGRRYLRVRRSDTFEIFQRSYWDSIR